MHFETPAWHAAARDSAAKLCGVTVLAVQPSAAEAFLSELQDGFADQDIKKHKFEVQDGYLAATGYVLAQARTGATLSLILLARLAALSS